MSQQLARVAKDRVPLWEQWRRQRPWSAKVQGQLLLPAPNRTCAPSHFSARRGQPPEGETQAVGGRFGPQLSVAAEACWAVFECSRALQAPAVACSRLIAPPTSPGSPGRPAAAGWRVVDTGYVLVNPPAARWRPLAGTWTLSQSSRASTRSCGGCRCAAAGCKPGRGCCSLCPTVPAGLCARSRGGQEALSPTPRRSRRPQVSSLPTSSEPTTPSSESPLSLDSNLREWLTEALATNASNPKVYTKLLVSNAAAGSIIGKVRAPAAAEALPRCPANSRTRGPGQTMQHRLWLGRPGMGTAGQQQRGTGGSAAGPSARPSSPPACTANPRPRARPLSLPSWPPPHPGASRCRRVATSTTCRPRHTPASS